MRDDRVVSALLEAGLRRAGRDEPLSRHTSWKVGGPADYYCVAEDIKQLVAAINIARSNAIPWLVLGGGYNVLVADAGVAGLVVFNRLRGIEIIHGDAGAHVDCGAGVFFAKAAHYTAQRGFAGMEWGVSIPGTVGGGVVNNAGAHWSDVSRALVDATLISEDGQEVHVTSDDLAYRYRRSALKKRHTVQSRAVVTRCRFALKPDSAAAALARIEELREHRLRTQPVKEASAGSTFSNPQGGHAGALIERAGLKGHRIGGAQIAPLHANFIVNTGSATAADIVELMRLAQTRVHELFDVDLEPEVQFVGRWSDAVLRSVLSDAA
ncbi:MAG: UDP-N-acetylmuramate dehydrogenase [Chloroflexota bacterium]